MDEITTVRLDLAKRVVRWAATVATYERIGYHKTLVAIANKHARLIWVLLTRDEELHAHAAAH